MDLNIEQIEQIGRDFFKSKTYEGKLEFQVPLKEHTTMKVGGNAAIFLSPENSSSLLFALSFFKLAGIKTYILGAGSNVIFDDKGFCGAVISTLQLNKIFVEKKSIKESQIETENTKTYETEISCGAGVLVDSLLEFCEKKGLGTLNTFGGLPASLGGACYMNARCYSVEISDFIKHVEYLDLDVLDNSLNILLKDLKNSAEELTSVEILKFLEENKKNLENTIKIYQNNKDDWSYKKSPFTNKNFVITKIALSAQILDLQNFLTGNNANKKVQDFLRSENQKYIQDRTKKGHFIKPSAGSVFKNNRDFYVPSGKLIDEAGLRGTVIGGAEISEWHGNFIVNNGNASAEDIKNLVELAERKVQEKFGFKLECEIIFV